MLLDGTLSAYEDYEAGGTPSAVLVGDDGRIASWLAAGADSIESLVEQALGGLGRAPGLPVGAELPLLELQRLDGGRELADLGDRPTVVLFWNPGCGFCSAMRGDLRAWEQERRGRRPRPARRFGGRRRRRRGRGFRLERPPRPRVGRAGAFGADGTPMAVLVDGEGRIASPLVTGADAVLELLGVASLAGSRGDRVTVRLMGGELLDGIARALAEPMPRRRAVRTVVASLARSPFRASPRA